MDRCVLQGSLAQPLPKCYDMMLENNHSLQVFAEEEEKICRGHATVGWIIQNGKTSCIMRKWAGHFSRCRRHLSFNLTVTLVVSFKA